MAEERPIVIRFVGEDSVTTVANKVSASVEKVGKSAGTSGKGLSAFAGTIGNVASAAGLAGGTVGALGSAIASVGGTVAIAVGGIVAIAGALGVMAHQSAMTADNVNALRRGIINLSDSQQEGEKLYSTLIDIASRTPFERSDVIEMGRSLLGAGIEAEKIPNYIYAIGDAVTTMGGDAQTIRTITTAIGRMEMAGKLSYEQMLQIQESGIPVFRLLAEATGRSTEEVIKLVQDGLLPAEQNLDTIIKLMQGTYGDAMASQMDTATQATSNLGDAWTDLATTLGTVTSPALNDFYNWLTDIINSTNEGIKSSNAYADAINPNRINEASESTRDWTKTQTQLAGALSLAEKSAYVLWENFKLVVSQHPWVRAINESIELMGKAWDEVVKSLENVWLETVKATDKLVLFVDEMVKSNPKVKSFADAVSGAWNWITTSATSAYNSTVNYANELVLLLGKTAKAISQAYMDEGMAIRSAQGTAFLYADTIQKIYVGNGLWIDSTNRTTESMYGLAGAVSGAGQQQEEYNLVIDDTAQKEKERQEQERRANELMRERERLLQEASRMMSDYNQRISDLRNSYMEIADAERSLSSAQKALQDAQDPRQIESMALALQMQQISLDDLNDSMAQMRTRRDEIAKALAGMTAEQIKYNALTDAERNKYKALGKDLDELRKRREAVRKALAGNKLTNQQRVEFLQTEAALTAIIGDKQSERSELEQKQKDALKKSEEERLKLLEEDKRLRDELEKAQIRYQQSLIAISQAQQNLMEAQDPNRLDAYRDAVTKARLNLEELRAEQISNAVSANQLASKLGITSQVMETLALSASDTATPLDDIALKSLDLSKAVASDGGTSDSVSGLSSAFNKLDDNASDAVSGLTKLESMLKSIDSLGLSSGLGKDLSSVADSVASLGKSNQSFATDNLTSPLNAISNVAKNLGSTQSVAFAKWTDSYRNALIGSMNSTAVANLVRAFDALKNAVGGSGTGSSGGGSTSGSSGNRRMMPSEIIVGGRSTQPATQNITIHLHYASAPSSRNPLKDVEDYLAAQGGRLRI